MRKEAGPRSSSLDENRLSIALFLNVSRASQYQSCSWVCEWVCKETWLLDWPANAVGDCRASSTVSTNQRASWGRLFSSDMAAGRFCIGHCSFPPPTRHLFISSTALKKKKKVFLDVSLFLLQLPWPLIPLFILSANTTLIEVDQILEITIT